jgi:hypothetical protein
LLCGGQAEAATAVSRDSPYAFLHLSGSPFRNVMQWIAAPARGGEMSDCARNIPPRPWAAVQLRLVSAIADQHQSSSPLCNSIVRSIQDTDIRSISKLRQLPLKFVKAHIPLEPGDILEHDGLWQEVAYEPAVFADKVVPWIFDTSLPV